MTAPTRGRWWVWSIFGAVLTAGLAGSAAWGGAPAVVAWLLVGAAGLSLLLVTNPMAVMCALAFCATALPKAGVKIGGFPFPVMLFGIGLLALVLRHYYRRPVASSDTRVILVTAYGAWVAWRVFEISPGGVAAIAAFAAWAVGPLALLVATTSVEGVPQRVKRSLELGFLAAVAYGLLQSVTGIERVAVAGLTYAYGDDLSLKNNTLASGGGVDLSKIPSTYQSGNIFGLVAAMMVILAMERLVGRRGSRLDSVVAVAGVIAITLSGSRTAVVALAVAGLVFLVRSGSGGRKVAILAVGLVSAVAVLVGKPDLLLRYSVEGAVASGGAGRVQQWTSALATTSPIGWLLGSYDGVTGTPEGWAGLLQQLGVVGAVLLLLCFGAFARRGFALAVVVLAVGAVLDSSFQLFPVWFLLPLVMACDQRVHGPVTSAPEARRGLAGASAT